MKQLLFIAILPLLVSCASGLPDTPIGDYGGWGPVIHQQEKGQPYSCWNGGTQITVRGQTKPDQQVCKLIERI